MVFIQTKIDISVKSDFGNLFQNGQALIFHTDHFFLLEFLKDIFARTAKPFPTESLVVSYCPNLVCNCLWERVDSLLLHALSSGLRLLLPKCNMPVEGMRKETGGLCPPFK